MIKIERLLVVGENMLHTSTSSIVLPTKCKMSPTTAEIMGKSGTATALPARCEPHMLNSYSSFVRVTAIVIALYFKIMLMAILNC